MLVLFETAAGYAIFQVLDESKLKECENVFSDLDESVENASSFVKLKQFVRFNDTTDALAVATATVEGKISKPLKKLLKSLVSQEVQDTILVADTKLGQAIKEKYNLSCLSSPAVQNLMRLIRVHMETLIERPEKEVSAMRIGLAHSLSRYKLKFSPDKIDTMIVQAIALLDDIDKEVNNYIMRCREWYGWHFPELTKLVEDHVVYCKLVMRMGFRTNAVNIDMSDLVSPEVEKSIKEMAEISIGTEISDEDITNINHLCQQVINISEYRVKLNDYLKNRMTAVAPNLTVLVGELVGARLISHAGSLVNLAKHPASTVQILGAEKALFRALKTKHDTPKYGLIYHASLVGKSTPKLKGKVSRMLAAKSSLAARFDALSEGNESEIGVRSRANLEIRMNSLEQNALKKISGGGKMRSKFEKVSQKQKFDQYKTQMDSTLGKRKASFGEKSFTQSKKARTE